jgi:hypothetical protein
MNEKDPEIIDRFIQLRAQGWPMLRISTELKVSRPTLIAWSRKHRFRIQNQRALETELISDRCKLSRQICLETLGEDLRRLREELARRDLADIPTARLLDLSVSLRAEANQLNGPLHLAEPISAEAQPDEITDPVTYWLVAPLLAESKADGRHL